MLVNSIEINNVRNISSVEITPIPQVNCFIGDNGAGKTSIFEALVILSKGRSFRSGQTTSLIRNNKERLRVFSRIQSGDGVHHRLGMERGIGHWSARHNGKTITHLSELTQLLPHVLLEPGSHTLVSGPPEGRRKYLDWGVFHVKRNHLPLWRRYSRTLKQRNAALRQQNRQVIESLDPQFAELGEQLHAARQQLVRRLTVVLQEQLPLFNRSLENLEMTYRKGWSADTLEEAVRQSVHRDAERGMTGPGPHRADLYLSCNGEAAKDRLSRGEQKALTAALIMAQAQLMLEAGECPVLLLDDLSSELDEGHLGKVLTAGMKLGAQIWLSGTKLSPVIAACCPHYAVFHVEHGSVSAAMAVGTKDA